MYYNLRTWSPQHTPVVTITKLNGGSIASVFSLIWKLTTKEENLNLNLHATRVWGKRLLKLKLILENLVFHLLNVSGSV